MRVGTIRCYGHDDAGNTEAMRPIKINRRCALRTG
jgi:hypothetical protein